MATDVADSRRHHHVCVVVGHAVIGLTDHVEIGWAVDMVGAHHPTIVCDARVEVQEVALRSISVVEPAGPVAGESAGVLGDAVALSAVTGNNWAPRAQHPGKDPLSGVAYPENVCRSKRNGTVFVM